MQRWLARLAMFVVATLGALTLTMSVTSRALAAPGDEYESWKQHYTINKDGSVSVEEKIEYKFGSPSSAHGITRTLITREPYNAGSNNDDRIFKISGISAKASDGVSSNVATEESKPQVSGASDRMKMLVIRVGDKNRTVGRDRVSYTLRYTVNGAIISPKDGDEFYYTPLTPTAGQVPVRDLRVTVTAPTDFVAIKCGTGASGSQTSCNTAESNGSMVTFAHSGLGQGKGMVIAATLPEGTVTKNQPILEPRGDRMNPFIMWLLALGTPIVAGLAFAWGWLWKRRHGTDERFIGLPPGVMPLAGQESEIGRDNKPVIPVAFAPPRMPVGEAGLLVDSSFDVRDTTATLVSLAVRGCLKLRTDQDTNESFVQIIDPSVATLPAEQQLVDYIFEGAPLGTEVSLSTTGAMASAHQAVADATVTSVAAQGLYARLPGRGFQMKQTPNAVRSNVYLGKQQSRRSTGPGLVWLLVFILGGVAFFLRAWWMLMFIVPLILLGMYIGGIASRGVRSAVGRAMTDQIEGFKLYLSTAEAEQLRFEEGEDIFSKYLPWAIAFDLTERWTKICQRLVELGRIPDVQPDWYYGGWPGYMYFDMGGIDHGLNNAFTDAVSSMSASDFGSGGSSFDSFSFDGGGGGGGGDSW